jgi:toxin CptA
MHGAPAVNYPVGRSGFHGCLLLFIGLIGLMVALHWSVLSVDSYWRYILYIAVYSVSSVAAGVYWYMTPCGDLDWNGHNWQLSTLQGTIGGLLCSHVDLQIYVLLSFSTSNNKKKWLWAEKSSKEESWSKFRIAVFSPGRTLVSPGASAIHSAE